MTRIPSDWKQLPLEHLAAVERGRFSARPRNDSRYYGGKIPFVQTGDIREAKTWLRSYSQTLNEDGLSVSRVFPAGTILVTIAATIGEVALTTFDVACPDSLVAVSPYKNVCAEWLLYALSVHRPRLEYLAAQNAQKNINLQVLRPLDILVPPLPEQRKIAQILSTWDEAIAAAEQLVAALQRRKKGLMYRLLLPTEATGQPLVRFPQFTDEWEHRQFDQVFERVTRKNAIGNTNVLTASGQRGLISQTEFFNRIVAGAQIENYYLLQRGEFAYNRSSSDGYPFGAIKRLDDHEAGILSTLYLCFRLAEDSSVSSFYKHFFEAGGMDRGIYSIAQEGARNHGLLNVSVGDFFSMSIPVPSRSEQQRLADFFDIVEQEIEVAKKQVEALKTQKKGLMQRLLTGQVRVQV